MWSEIHNPKKIDRHFLWISLNQFSAQLTKANICDWSYQVTFLLYSLIKDREYSNNSDLYMSQSLQQNHTLFTITLFATSQYLIYATFNLYTFCKSTYTDINLEYHWED